MVEIGMSLLTIGYTKTTDYVWVLALSPLSLFLSHTLSLREAL